jgi:hypothetical protein
VGCVCVCVCVCVCNRERERERERESITENKLLFNSDSEYGSLPLSVTVLVIRYS